MLRAHGYKVQVVNAGVPGDTTRGMLARLDASVPADARIVILQPGGNDLRFGYTKEERANNIRAMVARLQKRGIRVIVADNLQGLLAKHSADGIHFNGEAHALIAKKLYPQVVGALGGGATRRRRRRRPCPPARSRRRRALPPERRIERELAEEIPRRQVYTWAGQRPDRVPDPQSDLG